VSGLLDWLLAGFALLLARGRRRGHRRRVEPERIVPPGQPEPRAELATLFLFLAAAGCAIAFPVLYGLDVQPQTQVLGASLGLAFVFLAAACVLIGKRLVVTEEIEEEYSPLEHPDEQAAVEQIVEESGARFTRRRLIKLGAAAAGGSLGVALLTPVVSFGPVFDVDPFFGTPWRRGRRLVDGRGRPYRATDINQDTFYTAFPEGADQETIGAPIVVVRLDPRLFELEPDRRSWVPHGIVAYSKICTHAGCAISLYRALLFQRDEPRPALVCPCHYSTFDPTTGGTVLFGPAGRPLPQLPLAVDDRGFLRAGGNFSGPVGPSWWGVRNRSAKP
jgi:ubiquinol-cytochrome c reductase iron-sulfur subunit